MAYLSPKIRIFLITISIVFLIIKLFTAVVILKDDPTKFVVFKIVPSLNNELLLSSIENTKHIILFSDENGFIGDEFYYFITNYLWWVVLALTITYVFFSIKKEKLLTQRSSRH